MSDEDEADRFTALFRRYHARILTRVVVIRHGAMNPKATPGTIQYLDLKRTAGWTDTPPKRPLPGATRH
jgi:hypothetical protein